MTQQTQGYSQDFFGYKRLSDSPYVHWVWFGIALRDGSQLSSADGNMDIAIVRRGKITLFLVSGPTSKAQMVSYKAGDSVLGIRLKAGVYVTDKAAKEMVDSTIPLAPAGKESFWFGPHAITSPTYENTELFVNSLFKKGILAHDVIVSRALSDEVRGLGLRTIQLHFARTVGLTRKYVTQIQRAETAATLLQAGNPTIAVAHETGFTDQAHMTHSLKHFTGMTPKKLKRLQQDW